MKQWKRLAALSSAKNMRETNLQYYQTDTMQIYADIFPKRHPAKYPVGNFSKCRNDD